MALLTLFSLAAAWSFGPGRAQAQDTSQKAPTRSETQGSELPAADSRPQTATTSATALTLQEAMRLAGERSFTSQEARLSLSAAENRRTQARGQAFPRIELDAQRIWFSRDTNALTGLSPLIPKEVTTAGVTVAQPIIGLAPLLLQIRAAALQAKVARNQSDTSRRDARLQGADAFLQAVKAKALHDVTQKSKQLVDNQLREARAMERAGRLSRADVMRFELAAADAEAQLTAARITEQVTRLALAETLRSPNENFELSSDEISHFERSNLESPALESALQLAGSSRTESKNAEANIEVAKYYKLAADLDYLPSLNVFARYERDLEARNTTFPAPPAPGGRTFARDDIQDKFSYGLQLKWNIWDWGVRFGRSGEYQANVEKALLAKEASESQIRLEVTQAVLALEGATEGLVTAKSSVTLAEEVYRLTQARFQSGQATSSDVIAAEREQTRARGGLINVRGDLDVSWLKLKRALGQEPEFE